ncbi:inhibitory synaptic factor 1 [Notolabrus celidotus]|uniref:inhibitory synaptic factor 1 n=1 Tax=Notolabrus celidotus TaxID=1203425 RepID=UPI00148FDDEB|nr:inhibitory synaptic factor 1 [Notolabrus celidotus]
MSLSRAPARDTSETPSPRELIRSHMKMVINQLEGILIELKDVAKELREEDHVDYNHSKAVFLYQSNKYKCPSCAQWGLMGGTDDVRSC